jgi:hypothetical protein
MIWKKLMFGSSSARTIASIAVTPYALMEAIGNTQLMTATATYSDSSTGVVAASWSSSNTGVATVNSSTGVVTGVSAGTSTITATFDGHTTTSTVTIYVLHTCQLTFSMDIYNFQHVPVLGVGSSSDPDPVYGYGSSNALAHADAETHIAAAMATREIYRRLYVSNDGVHCTFLRYPDSITNRVIDYTYDASGYGSGGYSFYAGGIAQPYTIGINYY